MILFFLECYYVNVCTLVWKKTTEISMYNCTMMINIVMLETHSCSPVVTGYDPVELWLIESQLELQWQIAISQKDYFSVFT